MAIKFRKLPLDNLPPEHRILVDYLREFIEASAFVNLDELGRAMYRRPGKSTKTHRQRLSEVATGARFPNWQELELLADACGSDRVQLLQLHENARAKIEGVTAGDAALGREIGKFKAAYKHAVSAAFSRVRLPYPGNPKLVDFQSLYVQPSVSIRNRKPSHVSEIEASVTATTRRIVLLGDPGGGKSTLAAHLVLLSDSYKRSARLPFLIPFRQARQYFLDSSLSLTSFLSDWCNARFEVTDAQPAIRRLLESGGVTLIFDGLDELISMPERVSAVEKINMLARRYMTTSIVVTSRAIGYDEAPMDTKIFEEFMLGPFGEPSVRQFSLNWFKSIAEPAGQSPEERSASFLWEAENSASDLRTNPLILGLLCSLYSYDGYLPRNRPEVYEKCSSLLFDSWDHQRSIANSLPLNAHVKGAIGALALWMVESDSYSGVARRRVIAFLRDYLLGKRYEDADDAEDAATQLVDYCTGRAWVLTNTGSTDSDELYGFTHRTFLEYFCARQLVRVHGTASTLFDALLPRILASSGEIISQICVQILGSTVEDGADDWLRLACDWAEECDEPSQVAVLTGFLARALAYIVPRPDLVRRIVSKAYLQLKLDPSSEDFVRRLRGSPIVECMMANFENLHVSSNQLLHEVASSDTLATNPVELFYATYPYAPAAGNPRFAHGGYQGRAWGGFAPSLRSAGIDRIPHQDWPWVREYDLARGFISISEFRTRGGTVSELFEGNRPRGLVLPSFVVGLLALIGDGEPRYYRNDLNPDTFLSAPVCAELLSLLLDTPTPWLTYSEPGGTGTWYSPSSFALRRTIAEPSMLGLYALLLASQCDEQEIVSAGSDNTIERFRFWTQVEECSVTAGLEASPVISPAVAQFLASWRDGKRRLVSG